MVTDAVTGAMDTGPSSEQTQMVAAQPATQSRLPTIPAPSTMTSVRATNPPLRLSTPNLATLPATGKRD